QGRIQVRDEGQVVLAAGDNIYIEGPGWGANSGELKVFTGAYNPMPFMRANFGYRGVQWRFGGEVGENWVSFFNEITANGTRPLTDHLPSDDWNYVGPLGRPYQATDVITSAEGNRVLNFHAAAYLNRVQAQRVADVG